MTEWRPRTGEREDEEEEQEIYIWSSRRRVMRWTDDIVAIAGKPVWLAQGWEMPVEKRDLCSAVEVG